MSAGDHRDLVIEQLSDELLEAQAMAVELRLLAVAALEKIHEQHLALERQRRQFARLRDEYRTMRAAAMRKAIAA